MTDELITCKDCGHVGAPIAFHICSSKVSIPRKGKMPDLLTVIFISKMFALAWVITMSLVEWRIAKNQLPTVTFGPPPQGVYWTKDGKVKGEVK